jgi:hypothetical protein
VTEQDRASKPVAGVKETVTGLAGAATTVDNIRADYIRRIVDAAPPLSPQQRDQLVRLMRPSRLAEPEAPPLEERKAS